MEYLSISLNHHQFLVSMFYTSQWISLPPPWSGLFIGIFFNAIFKGIFFFKLSDISLIVKRNATYFCMVILYPDILLNLFISLNSFCVEFLGFSMLSIMSSAYNDNFTSFLPIFIPFIIFLI